MTPRWRQDLPAWLACALAASLMASVLWAATRPPEPTPADPCATQAERTEVLEGRVERLLDRLDDLERRIEHLRELQASDAARLAGYVTAAGRSR